MYAVEKNYKKVYLERDLVTDARFDDMTLRLNVFNVAFDGSNGLGHNANNSNMILFHAGGFDDQRITASLKYSTATTLGNEDISVMARFRTNEEFETQAEYYYAAVDDGKARLIRVKAGVFTTLSQTPFILYPDEWVEISLTCVNQVHTATFESSGMGKVMLRAIDSQISGGGLMGIRSLTSSIFCRSFTAEQL